LFALNTTVPTGFAYEGQVIGLPTQLPRGANLSVRGGLLPPPSAGAGAWKEGKGRGIKKGTQKKSKESNTR